MKKLLLLATIVFAACGQTPMRQTAELRSPSDGVEVLLFHTKQRCPTCIAIEQRAREVIETNFVAQLADGSLVFRVVDISEQEALADKYEVTWSSLLINRHREGEEHVNNLTKFAFANARTNPEKFKEALKIEIEKLLGE